MRTEEMEFLKQERIGTEFSNEDTGGESLISQSDFQLNDDYLILHSLWKTELNAPELLPYSPDLVETIKKTLEDQQVC